MKNHGSAKRELRYWPSIPRNVAVIVLLAIFEFPFTPTQVKPSSHFVTGNMYLRIFLHTDVKVGVKSLRYLLS